MADNWYFTMHPWPCRLPRRHTAQPAHCSAGARAQLRQVPWHYMLDGDRIHSNHRVERRPTGAHWSGRSISRYLPSLGGQAHAWCRRYRATGSAQDCGSWRIRCAFPGCPPGLLPKRSRRILASYAWMSMRRGTFMDTSGGTDRDRTSVRHHDRLSHS